MLFLLLRNLWFAIISTLQGLNLEKTLRYDHLTGVFNRGSIMQELRFQLDRANRYGSDLTVAFVDVNKFKEINDQRGHSMGDKALKIVARDCKRDLRSYDAVGRYAGDEFVIIFSGLNSSEADKAMKRIAKRTAQSKISFSYGLAQRTEDCNSVKTLISTADENMYRQKRTTHLQPAA